MSISGSNFSNAPAGLSLASRPPKQRVCDRVGVPLPRALLLRNEIESTSASSRRSNRPTKKRGEDLNYVKSLKSFFLLLLKKDHKLRFSDFWRTAVATADAAVVIPFLWNFFISSESFTLSSYLQITLSYQWKRTDKTIHPSETVHSAKRWNCRHPQTVCCEEHSAVCKLCFKLTVSERKSNI